MGTLVYHNAGELCLHTTQETAYNIKKHAKKNGQIGYLTGYRYYDGKREPVMCFFTEKPTSSEILRRRENGFKAARWIWLHVKR